MKNALEAAAKRLEEKYEEGAVTFSLSDITRVAIAHYLAKVEIEIESE